MYSKMNDLMEQWRLVQVYVLNVKNFEQRRLFMQQQLAAFNMQAEFILDGDIEDLTPQRLAEYFSPDTNMSAAQKSCAFKHILALQAIIANPETGMSLILEDDAVLAKDFLQGVQRALAQSEQFPGEKVIYLGAGGNFFTPQSQRRPGQYLYPGKRGRFTDSYLIDKATAEKRLAWIMQNKVSISIDNQFDLMDKQSGIQILWLEDPVVEQGSKNGLFASALEAAPPLWLKACLFQFEKLKRKYIYQLWR